MHFVEIANTIIECKFDKKKINLQAVHNELIRHDEFVLIGRGIYGLSEWGFKSGTVADVISAILDGKESMSQEEIIAEVLKQRQVKPITVVLSLKNKNQFIRVGRKQYSLKMA
jgi:Holliday junction resolvasome RuvABC DNA-binding subunit